MSKPGNGAALSDEERWDRQAREHDRAQEHDHALRFVLAEVRDLRRHFDDQIGRLVVLHTQMLTKLDGMNDVLGRFMALANDHDQRLAVVETAVNKTGE